MVKRGRVSVFICNFTLGLGLPLSKTSLVNKAFAIISRSAKSLGNLLDGNNVTEIIVIRHSVWSALVYYVIEMHLAIGVVYSC